MEPLITSIVTNPTSNPKHYPWVVPGGLALDPLTSTRLPFDVCTAATDRGKQTLLADIDSGRVIIAYEVRSDIKVLGKVNVGSNTSKREEPLVESIPLIEESVVKVQTAEEKKALVEEIKAEPKKEDPKKAFNLFEVEKNTPFKNSLTVGKDAKAVAEKTKNSAFSKTASPESVKGRQPGPVNVPLRKIF